VCVTAATEIGGPRDAAATISCRSAPPAATMSPPHRSVGCVILTPGVNITLRRQNSRLFPPLGGEAASGVSPPSSGGRESAWPPAAAGSRPATTWRKKSPPPAILAVCYATASMQVADRHNLSYDGSIYPPPLWRWINTGRHLPVAAGLAAVTAIRR